MFERYTEKANPATLPEVQHQSPELLAAADPSLGEDRALALLKRADLRAEVLARLSKNAGDMKSTAEDALMNRLETISSGERLSLAHRASGRIAAELLCDIEPRVIHGALDNSQLTEAEVIRALMRADAPVLLVESVCAHAKWSLRRDIRIALLRNENTPLVRMIEFGRSLPIRLLREILRSG